MPLTSRTLRAIALETEAHAGSEILLTPDGLSLRLRRTVQGRRVAMGALIGFDELEAARKPRTLVGITLYRLEREIDALVASEDP